MKLVATRDRVGGHEYVIADPEDEFWKSKGYVPADEDYVDGGVSAVDEEELEIDLHAMTIPELNQFVKDYNLPVDLANHRLKDEKIKAIEEAIEEFGLEGDEDEDVPADDVVDEDTDDGVEPEEDTDEA